MVTFQEAPVKKKEEIWTLNIFVKNNKIYQLIKL